MKKIILLTILSLAICQTVNAQIQDVVMFSYNDLTFDTIGEYTRVSMFGCGATNNTGHPELPRFEIKYIIPLDKQVSDVTVTDSVVNVLQGNYKLYPKQNDIPIGDTITNNLYLDSLIYRSDCFYFNNMIEYVGQFYEFGYHVALFYIYPLNYNPSQRKLQFCSSLSFTIQLSNCNTDFRRPKKESRRMFELTKKLVTTQIRNEIDFSSTFGGPMRIVEANEKLSITMPLLQNASEVLPEYIIITNDRDIHGNEIESYNGQTMTDIFQTFADWKTKKGIPTIVVKIDDICANYSGNDIQDKIHNFLSDIYWEFGTMYVLFGGDVNVVPERMSDTITIHNSMSEDKFSFPTDLYYTAIETSWDSNGNGVYGEFPPEDGDITDNTPEFLYGRIPVENCYEAMVFLTKNMTYEKLTNVENVNYVNNVTMMVGMLNDSHSSYQSFVRANADAALGLFIKWNNGVTKTIGIVQDNIVRWRLFEDFYLFDDTTANHTIQHSIGWENHSFNLCKNNVIGALGTGFTNSLDNEFPHLVFHTDHSSYLSLGTSAIYRNETIDRNDVGGFLNAPYYHILMTQGCSPGEFQKDCIAERFLNNPNGGAVAVLASSSTSYKGYESSFQSTFISSCYDYSDLYNSSYASLFNIGSIYYRVHQQTDNEEMGVFVRRKNHLFGDPELPIWTREPVDLTVSTSPSIITNQNGQLTVSVSGMVYSEYSTNDMMVCVMKDGEIYLREPYNGTAHSHDFVFTVNPETAGDLMVTVIGHNYIPYETTVPVNITGKNVYISEKIVMDEAGNDDGNLDAGETDFLSIALKNNGTVNLTNVTATLSCEFLDESLNQNINDYLTIITATANYGSITQNTTVSRNNFKLALSNAIPDRTSLRCTLTISDGNGVVCERYFTLPIGAPEIEYVSVHHEEKQNGRIGLDIELNNLGWGMAKGVAAALTSPSNVQIIQGSATYGEMDHLEAKTESFEFIPNDNIDNTIFALTITDAYNKTWSYSFNLNIVSDTVENLTFTNTEHSIKLKWDPVEGSRGYYVYRSSTANGNYERLFNYPIPSAVYPDLELEVKHTYYYGVSYLDEYGNESKKARITAWTSLPIADGWPIFIPDNLGRAWGTAPNVDDINGDGQKEIFLTTGTADNPGNMGAILGFNSLGEEIYDIDHNPTTVSGFANLGISMNCTPAVADIDNDSIVEIVVATRGDSNGTNHDLLVFKNRDADNDGVPDLAWKTSLDTSNFNGVVLADLDNDGALEIIAPNQGRQGSNTHIQVFDCHGDTIRDIRIPYTYNIDQKAVTMPIVADFDNDGRKEIVFGLEGGVYSWSSHTTPQLSTLVPYDHNNGERTDCPVIAADIDGDGELEILYMAIRNLKGYIRAVEFDGAPVSSVWSGDNHYISLSSTDPDWGWPPYFCVADLDNDGSIEVFAADNGALKMWHSDGTAFGIGEIQIQDLDCRYFQPVIADVDGNGDCEIIIPSQNGYIYAYKSNGDAVPGWPLAVVDLATIPAVTDIDGDGFNEVVASSQTELYVWHTEGESIYNHWDRFRCNKYNNAVYEIPCTYNELPTEITDIQTWNDDRQINRDVVVNSGAKLTIKSKLSFSEDSKIIVKPGGRLIIDGGKLTNACFDEMWQGIEVWGDTCTHQQEINGSFGQGYLELKNGAVIENAKCAVELWHPGYGSTTGGIIHAMDATFRNNAMAVHALNYSNVFNGVEIDYNGYFRNCTFTIDENYIGTILFSRHVNLVHVKGLNFLGCSFSVMRNVFGVLSLCVGIGAYSSSFKVNSYCDDPYIKPCPEENTIRSYFNGFYRGIHVSNDGGGACAFSVKNSEFYDNTCGIYALNSGYGTIVNNDFAVDFKSGCNFGIYIDGVANFCIEDNTFHAQKANAGSPYGIEIVNSQGINDVYNNDFCNLQCGNVAVGANIGNMITPNENLGLTYSCNTNTGNTIDFCVLKDGSVGDIASPQGSSTLPAGNTFSGSQYHFYNNGNQVVSYYFDIGDPNQMPATSLLYRVSAKDTQSSNICLSHYGGGNLVSKTASEKAALTSEYLSARSTYNSLLQLYESRIDGGSTPTQMADINSATPSDMWRLRAQLLGLSPYVSGDVLTTAVDRYDVFTDPVLFEILAANPDELKKDTLISYLENKEHPLPAYMTDLLRQMASGFTARTALFAQMAQYRHTYSLAAGDIVRSCLNDSVTDLTELRTWLGNMDDIASDRMIVASYLQEGDSTNAFTLANMLPELYHLQGDALADHSDYMRLIGLYQTLNREHRSVFELTDTEAAMVNGIASSGIGTSQAMADALLEEISEEPTRAYTCPTMPENNGGNRDNVGSMDASMNEALGFTLSVSPNPATTWTTITYTLPADATKANIILTNTLGITVATYNLSGNDLQKVLDLRSLASGVYTYTVSCGKHSQTGKLVIVK